MNKSMGLLLLSSALLLVIGLKLAGYEPGAKGPPPPPREPIYDESMNVEAAIELATQDGQDRNLLLMLGGNWCGWCYRLHDLLHQDEAITKLMNERFQLIHVDIRSNPWILERYDTAPRGYPFLIVLGGWFVKVFIHPEMLMDISELWTRFAVGGVPSSVILGGALLFYGSLMGVVWAARHIHGGEPADEIAGLERNLEHWKL